MSSKGIAGRLGFFLLGYALAAAIPAFADGLSATDFYMKYRTALAGASKIEQLQSMLCKKANEEIDGTPAGMKPMLFGLMKAMGPKSVQVLSEEVTSDTATLILSGKTEPATANANEKTSGKVTLVKEDGAWKIGKEFWDSKIQVGEPQNK